MCRPTLNADDITVLICSEANAMYAQSLVLCDSIRTFAGAYSNIEIIAVSPRPQLALDRESQARLRDFDVEYVLSLIHI